MKVKVKKGIGVISNASVTYKEGRIYEIPNNKFDSEIFEKIESSESSKTYKMKRGKR